MRYQINRDSKPIAKFTLKPDAIRLARAVARRKGVTNVTILDKRDNEIVAF
jgi:hypothetical protein